MTTRDKVSFIIFVPLIAFSLAIALGGCDDNPKFHYNDCVRIEDNFYGPTYGIVTKYDNFNGYTVSRKIGNVTSNCYIHVRYLTKVDNSFCKE